MLVPALVPTLRATLIDTIKNLGLTSGLKLCLDAGDANSYTSGSKWLDVSGNGYDFDFGASSSAEATDPTFSGTAGKRSAAEYMLFADGDFMEYDSSNETWMNNLHKNNALFTIAAWAFIPATIAPDPVSIICGTSGGSASKTGVSLYAWEDDNTLGAAAYNSAGGTTVARSFQSTGTVSRGAWNFLAISVDEAGDAATMQVNATQSSHSASYSSPSAGSATHTLRLADDGNANFAAAAGFRMQQIAAWEGVALSAVQLSGLFQATRGKFGV